MTWRSSGVQGRKLGIGDVVEREKGEGGGGDENLSSRYARITLLSNTEAPSLTM
jgi:hypothetical protein